MLKGISGEVTVSVDETVASASQRKLVRQLANQFDCSCAQEKCNETAPTQHRRPSVAPNSGPPSWVLGVGFFVIFILLPVVLFLIFTAGADYCKKSVLWTGENDPRTQPKEINKTEDDDDDE